MKKLLTLLLLLACSACARAQIDSPVKWSYASKKTGDKQAVVFLKATIQKGWHIYSQTEQGGPAKSSFTFSKSKDYSTVGKIVEPKPLSRYEQAFGMNIGYFETAVVFQQKIKLGAAKSPAVKGKLGYIACNDHKCNPPEEVEFNIPLSN
ncbi:MAG: protein-disulfide reductase DsbD domain-containing protein [Mucilaginibacter sp.]